jgi:hypothetical protein
LRTQFDDTDRRFWMRQLRLVGVPEAAEKINGENWLW